MCKGYGLGHGHGQPFLCVVKIGVLLDAVMPDVLCLYEIKMLQLNSTLHSRNYFEVCKSKSAAHFSSIIQKDSKLTNFKYSYKKCTSHYHYMAHFAHYKYR